MKGLLLSFVCAMVILMGLDTFGALRYSGGQRQVILWANIAGLLALTVISLRKRPKGS